MPSAVVKWFSSQKGYGFLDPGDGGSPDVFVHISAVEKAGLKDLQAGQKLSFELDKGKNGKDCAVNLVLE